MGRRRGGRRGGRKMGPLLKEEACKGWISIMNSF